MSLPEVVEVLVLAKAYPNPSRLYGEGVCVAGVTRDGHWMRLYPIDFRHLPKAQQFSKWQWVRASVRKARTDPRAESYRPDQASLEPLESLEGWGTRRDLIGQLLSPSLESLKESEGSLGVVKPAVVRSFGWESRRSASWSPEERAHLSRASHSLFGHGRRVPTLERIGYTFYYEFACGERCGGHKLSVVDWELIQSYRRWRVEGYGAPPDALHDKYFTEFAERRDLHFILGTIQAHDRHRTFVIIGLFYPPKIPGARAEQVPIRWT